MTYQFNIQIKGFKNPEVWRQVTVPSDYTFSDFHKVIRIAFEKKQDDSVYTFSDSEKDAKILIIPVNLALTRNTLYGVVTRLSSLFKYQGQRFYYYTDLAEHLQHHITLEKIITEDIPYAHCLAGEGEFPPETCEGPEDFEKMKLILSDINHPEYESIRDWLELDKGVTWEDKYKFNLSEVNEQLLTIDTPVKSFRNYIVVNYDAFDKEYGLNPSLWRKIDEIRDKLTALDKKNTKNWKGFRREVEMVADEFPNIPHFKNTLAIAYTKTGEKEQSFKILHQLLEQYPDYIISRCNLVQKYISDEQLDKAYELLGKNFDLSELYPSREGEFTEVEIFNYHITVFKYFLSAKNNTEATKHLDFIEYLFPNKNFEVFRMELDIFNIGKFFDESKRNNNKAKLIKVIPEQVVKSNHAPDFENPEMTLLYKYDDKIRKDILYRILKLPRESVIKDLEKIIIDSIARFDYFNKHTEIDIPDAPIHALIILSVLRAEDSLDTLFTMLRQDKDYYNMWYGDMFTEFFWQFVYAMGQNRLDRLKDFALEPNRYTFSRTLISKAVAQIAIYQVERKEEVRKWFEDVLQYMMDHQNDENVFDRDVYRLWIEDLIDISDREQLPVIMRFYDKNLIEDREYLTLYEIKKLLAKSPSEHKDDVFSTLNQYYDCWQSWLNNVNKFKGDFEDDVEDKFPVPAPQKSLPSPAVSSKIGRNDPCPCGSGKKYKKCCGVNQ
jgi:uncharacterized protein YecA (UPF0149 family)